METRGSSPPDQIKTRLLKGENVVWWGRPAQGIKLTASDGLLIPVSLFWCGFMLFWETNALRSKAPFPFALFGIPFILVGIFLVIGRFLADGWLRSHAVYALTDHRVLIVRSGPWPSFVAVNLDQLPAATLNESSGGQGTIRFGSPTSMFGFNNGIRFSIWVPSLEPTPQFLWIADAQRVFTAIQERARPRS